MNTSSVEKQMKTKKIKMVIDDIGSTLESPYYNLSRSEQKTIIDNISRALDKLLVEESKQKKNHLRIVK